MFPSACGRIVQSGIRNIKRLVTLIVRTLTVLASTWISRAVLSLRLPELQVWHRPVLLSEYRARDYPEGVTFAQYRELESKLVAEIRERVEAGLTAEQKVLTNRYFEDAPAHPSAWPMDWNLSYERIPEQPLGGIVLLHGASDSPYSMRALAEAFFQAGLYVIAPRLPGNGTVPGELTETRPEDWTTIAPMALAQARNHVPSALPVYLGGYSAGGALALS